MLEAAARREDGGPGGAAVRRGARPVHHGRGASVHPASRRTAADPMRSGPPLSRLGPRAGAKDRPCWWNEFYLATHYKAEYSGPSPEAHALAHIVQRCAGAKIITQNVDGLHRRGTVRWTTIWSLRLTEVCTAFQMHQQVVPAG